MWMSLGSDAEEQEMVEKGAGAAALQHWWHVTQPLSKDEREIFSQSMTVVLAMERIRLDERDREG